MPFVDKIKSMSKKTFLKLSKLVDMQMNGSCLVLLYHRVYDYQSDPQLLAVRPENFEEQINYLKENYSLLSVEQFSWCLKNKLRFPNKSVLITFDDGYADNYLYALPILEKLKVQALFYISTGNLNSEKCFWWDELEQLLLKDGNKLKAGTFTSNGVSMYVDSTLEVRMQFYHTLLLALRSMNTSDRQKVLDDVYNLIGSSNPTSEFRCMTNEEVKKMAKSHSAIIGAHSVNHPSLTACSKEEMDFEIAESKKVLEQITGKSIIHFSFPYGTKNDYNSQICERVKYYGFEFSSANYPYPVISKSECYAFPRFLIRDWTVIDFAKQLKAFSK